VKEREAVASVMDTGDDTTNQTPPARPPRGLPLFTNARRRAEAHGLWPALLNWNSAAVAFYFIFAAACGLFSQAEALAYSSPDSLTYRAVADWLYGRSADAGALKARPFLYPLILGALRLVTGRAWLLWLFQFGCWLAAANLLAAGVYRATRRPRLWQAAFALFALNVSLITLTFHALTETVALLLTSLLVCHLAGGVRAGGEAKFFFVQLLLLSCLTVVKPTYQLPLLFAALYALVKFARRPAVLARLPLALAPVAVQLVLMKAAHGYFALSTISTYTVNNYYLPRVQLHRLKQPFSDETVLQARAVFQDFSPSQALNYLAAHVPSAALVYWQSLKENLLASSLLAARQSALLYYATEAVNAYYFGLHCFFLPLAVYLLARRRGSAWLILFPLVFVGLGFLATGISYWQGDRLIAPLLPMWVFLYAYVLHVSRPAASNGAGIFNAEGR
jgi:hypothetical protein